MSGSGQNHGGRQPARPQSVPPRGGAAAAATAAGVKTPKTEQDASRTPVFINSHSNPFSAARSRLRSIHGGDSTPRSGGSFRSAPGFVKAQPNFQSAAAAQRSLQMTGRDGTASGSSSSRDAGGGGGVGEDYSDYGAQLMADLHRQNARAASSSAEVGGPRADGQLDKRSLVRRGRGGASAGLLAAAAQQEQDAQFNSSKVLNPSYLAKHLHKIKNRDKKKSRSFASLSYVDEAAANRDTYAPISLPFVYRDPGAIDGNNEKDDEERGGAGSGSERKEQEIDYKPRVPVVDEASRQTAYLLQPEDCDAEERQWLLVQLPAQLPALDLEAMKQDASADDGGGGGAAAAATASTDKGKGSRGSAATPTFATPYEPSTLAQLPEGYIGKLKVYSSGRTQLVLNGAHVFNVHEGADCNFSQDAVCLMEKGGELMFLGNCHKRIVATPDIHSIVSGGGSHGERE
eukprot:GHVU01111340.1.p1 GENE.GHVU01111340.1~~GHVU01111340.1.p1  ORF type:complete len:459 (-),score=97.01 GHVU01111340.1:168-1544(-)